MTETITPPPPEAASGADFQIDPADILLHLIVTCLAPMFLGVTAGNIDLARLAAIETVNAYHARNHADLLAIAQIVACGLAALGSLNLSMADDISIAMALRLRGNAIALNRSAEQNRRAMRANRRGQAPPHEPQFADHPEEAIDTAYEAAVIANVAAAQKTVADAWPGLRSLEPTPIPAPPPSTAPSITGCRQDATGPASTGDLEQKFTLTSHLPPAHLSPAECQRTSHRAAALSSTASHLIAGPPTREFSSHPREPGHLPLSPALSVR